MKIIPKILLGFIALLVATNSSVKAANGLENQITPNTNNSSIEKEENTSKNKIRSLSDLQGVFKDKLIPKLANEFGLFSEVANLWLQKLFELGYGKMSQEINQVLGKAGLPDLNQIEKILKTTRTKDLAPLSTVIYDNFSLTDSEIIKSLSENNLTSDLGKAIADGTTFSKTAQEKNQAVLKISAKTVENSLKLAENSQTSRISQEILQDVSTLLAYGQSLELFQIEQNQKLLSNVAIITREFGSLRDEILAQRLETIRNKNAAARLERKQSGITLPLLYPKPNILPTPKSKKIKINVVPSNCFINSKISLKNSDC